MLYSQKMLPLTIPACLLVLTQLPLILCSSLVLHSRNRREIQMDAKLLSEIEVHGFLSWASMGFLLPVGILVMRKSNGEQYSKKQMKILFYIHGTIQTLSVLLVTVGAVMSFMNFPNAFDNDHQRLGLVLYGLVWIQFLVGIVRPNRGSQGRIIWFLLHWLLGIGVSLLGVINTYIGLLAYHKKTARSIRIWIILFTVEISLLTLFYLFQEKWEYIRKQRSILGNEPVKPTEPEILSNQKQNEQLG